MSKPNARALRKAKKVSGKAKRNCNLDAAVQLKKWKRLETVLHNRKKRNIKYNQNPEKQSHKNNKLKAELAETLKQSQLRENKDEKSTATNECVVSLSAKDKAKEMLKSSKSG